MAAAGGKVGGLQSSGGFFGPNLRLECHEYHISKFQYSLSTPRSTPKTMKGGGKDGLHVITILPN